jgi:hypothetical protein
LDLSEQLEIKFLQLKEKQKDVLKLYRGSRLSMDEVENFQKSIGNLISTNGYLSTSSDFSVAFGFATKSPKREGFVRGLFEYQVDLQVVQKIVIADIREYSAFPEEAEVLVDIGKFKIFQYVKTIWDGERKHTDTKDDPSRDSNQTLPAIRQSLGNYGLFRVLSVSSPTLTEYKPYMENEFSF